MFLTLLACAVAVDPSVYRRCDQSPFCKRTRLVRSQKWSIVQGSWKVENNVFTATICDATFANYFLLRVSVLSAGIPRIRIEPRDAETFERYDPSVESVIVNQTTLNSLASIKVTENATHIIVTFEQGQLVVGIAKLRIDFVASTGETVVALNMKDQAVFETRRPQNYSEPYTFGGHTDYYKNGASAVALDATFFGDSVQLSGVPGHTLPLNLPETWKDGDPIRHWNTDINSYEINSRLPMYGAVPFIIGHSKQRFTGLFWLNPSDTWIDTRFESGSKNVRFMSESCFIDVFLFHSNKPGDVMDRFTLLTGRPQLVPLWALGLHQSKWGYKTQDEVLEVNRKLDEVDAPHESIWMDLDYTDDRKYFTWNPNTFSDPLGLLRELSVDDRKMVIVLDPHLKVSDAYRVYREARDQRLLIRDTDGNEFHGNCWPGTSAWPDFFMEQARDWWALQHSFDVYTLSASNLFMWNDMNEISVFSSVEASAPKDVLHIGDHEEREVHNAYGLMMVAGTFKGLVDREADKNRRPFILSRSYFAGSQKYTVLWSGDNTADWNHLKNSIQLVLSFGIGGQVYSGSDVGGFFFSPDENLLSRWYQLGAWCYPFYRVHCHEDSAYRELYRLTGKYFTVAREGVYDRYRLSPYWYTLARHANLTGEPLVRPLWWEFDDEACAAVDDKLMIGRSLLVSPFLEENPQSMRIQLPANTRWYSYYTGEEVSGEVEIPFEDGKTPVFIRGGSIIPYRPTIKKTITAMKNDPIALKICFDENDSATGDIYIDDGETFNFLSGDYFYKHFRLSRHRLTSSTTGSRIPNIPISRIEIFGMTHPVTSIRHGNRELPFTSSATNLTITPLNLSLAEDFEIVLL